MEKLEWLQAFAEPEQPETGAAAPTPEQQERLAAISPEGTQALTQEQREAAMRQGYARLKAQFAAVQGKCLLGVFRLAGHGRAVFAHICHFVVVLCAAGCQRQHHKHSQQQCDPFLHVHFDSSMFAFFVVFSPPPKL